MVISIAERLMWFDVVDRPWAPTVGGLSIPFNGETT
jgi:hypothetical protein